MKNKHISNLNMLLSKGIIRCGYTILTNIVLNVFGRMNALSSKY